MPFQKTVSIIQATSNEGDPASANPLFSVPSPTAGFIAGAVGVIVGRFVWLDPSDITGRSVINSGTGIPLGFVMRNMQAQIVQYLDEAGMTVFGGKEVNVVSGTDFYARIINSPSVRGQKAFAELTTGRVQPAAAGSVIPGFIETNFYMSSDNAVGELAVITGK